MAVHRHSLIELVNHVAGCIAIAYDPEGVSYPPEEQAFVFKPQGQGLSPRQ